MKNMKNQPLKSVQRIVCPICGELQMKIYPWSSFEIPAGTTIPPCKKHKRNEK